MASLPARRPSFVCAPATLWLLVLAFCLRALVPAGYMPDSGALFQGRAALALCPASGPIPGAAPGAHGLHHRVALDDRGHPGDPGHLGHPSDHDGHGHNGHQQDGDGQDPLPCSFWLAAQQALHQPAAALSVPPPQKLDALAPSLPAPMFFRPAPTGPPLGPRAPPLLRT